MRARLELDETEISGERLAWEASPTRHLLTLAWPIAVGMISYSLMTLTSTLFVARLGADALAGVGLGGIAAFTLLCFFMGMLRAVKVLGAQSVGAGRAGEARVYLGAGLLVAIVAGVVLAVLAQPLSYALPLLTATGASGENARTYFAIRMLSAPAFLGFVALREHRWSLGDSRSPMIAAVAGNVVNIVLDAVLIFGLGYGVGAAAVSTCVGHLVEIALVALAQRADGGVPLRRVTARHVAAMFSVGLPTGAQWLLEVGSFAMLTAMLVALSDVQGAAHQAAIQAIHFTFLPVLAVSEAGAVLAGQAVGARRNGLVRTIAVRAFAVASIYAGLWTVLLALFADAFAGAFTDEPVLRAAIASLLTVAAVFQLFDAANCSARSALLGAGDTRYPAVVGVVTAWLLTPPSTWFLGYHLGLGALGGWLGLTGEIIIGSFVLWARLRGNGWHAAAERTRREMEDAERAEGDAVRAA